MSSKAVYSMFFISTEALKCNRSTVNRRVTRMSHLSASCFSEILVFFIFFALFRPLLVGVVHWHPFLGCHLAIGLALNFCSATHKTRAIDLFNCWIITFIIIIIIKSFVWLKCDNLAGVIYGIKIKTSVWRIENLGFISYFFRNRTQSRCPYISAMRAGLSPQQSSLSIGAWRECSSRSTASRPDSAAKCAGVHPCSVLRLGLAPCSMRILTVSVCPVEKRVILITHFKG